MRRDTPPSSIQGDDEIMDDEVLEEEDLEYVGDLDEVLDAVDNENYNDSDVSEDGEEINDDAVSVFSRHTGSVFCGSLHPTLKLAATGGEDDRAFVWNIETGKVVFESNEHEDSVIIASFSYDGAYLATADMSGSVRVIKCPAEEEGDWNCIWDYQAGDLSWGHWHHGARVLFCGATTGEVYMWKIPSGETKVMQGHGQKSECGNLLADGRRLAVAYEDGSIKIWDLKSSTINHNIPPEKAHSASIPCIDSYHDNNVIATGSLDGKVLMMKSVTGKSIGILDAGSEVESLAFSKDVDLGLLAVGTLDGSLSIWEVGRQTVRHKCSDKSDEDSSGITSLIWVHNHLMAACLDGSIKVYDAKTGNLVKTITGHRSEILDMCYSSNLDTILTTSDDGTARIFKLDLSAS